MENNLKKKKKAFQKNKNFISGPPYRSVNSPFTFLFKYYTPR